MKLVPVVFVVAITVAPSLAPQAYGESDGAIIHLSNGRSQAGVLRTPDTADGNTWLERDVGVTVSYTRRELSRIERTDTPLSRLYARESEIQTIEDAAARLPARKALAAQAEEQGFPQFARQQARVILQEANATQTPDTALCASAHAALGHVLHDGAWMTEADAWAARGYVRFGGRWIPATGRERMLAERAADRRHRAEIRLQRQRLAAERQTAAIDQVSVLSDGGYGYSPSYWGFNPAPGHDPGRKDRRHHRPTSVRQLWDTPWWADTVHARTYGTAARHPRGRPFHPRPRAMHTTLPGPGHGGGNTARALRGGRPAPPHGRHSSLR
jgi:hypothetical protein